MAKIMIMDRAIENARKRKQDIITVENLFEVLQENQRFINAYNSIGGDSEELAGMIDFYFSEFDYNNEELCSELKRISESNNLNNIKYSVGRKAAENGGAAKLSMLIAAVYEELDQSEFIVQALVECTRKKEIEVIAELATYIANKCDIEIEMNTTIRKLGNPAPNNPPKQLVIGLGGPGGPAGFVQLTPLGNIFNMNNGATAQPMTEEQIENSTSTELRLEEYRELVSDVRKRASGRLFTGRKDKLQELVDVLCRKDKGNIILVGEAGVGKSAIIDGFADYINKDVGVPNALKNVDIVELDTSDLIRDTKYRGDFESKFVGLLEQLEYMADTTGKCVVLCIDEIHTLMGIGESGSSNLDGSSILKKFIENGKIKVIGCTTFDEHRTYVEKKKAFCRRFKIVKVEETTVDETITILNGIKKQYEEYHGVAYTEEAIQSCVELSSKYIKEKFLPDKAIDLMDSCGAYVVAHSLPNRTVGKEVVEQVISTICKIPKERIEENKADKLKTLASDMKKRVFGQDEAIAYIERAIMASEAGLNDENKPIASLMFAGPTGTGKTETARALAEKLGVPLLKYDMAEYSDETSVNKFIGAGQGYIGYEDGSLLVNDVRKNPYSVVLLDEIEKAHPKIFDVLLGVMDDGKLTDSRGTVADFTNVVLIMTSNVGASYIGKRKLGFTSDNSSSSVGYESIDEEMKRMFKPEFRNRLSGVVKFNGINDDMALFIANKLLQKVLERVRSKGFELDVHEDVYNYIIKCGITLDTGAREMERCINMDIKPLLSELVLFGNKDSNLPHRLVVGETGKVELLSAK